jgi:penicillin-binding protein 1A
MIKKDLKKRLLVTIVLFALFFLAGASLGRLTPWFCMVLTDIDDWEYIPQEQSVIYYYDGQEMGRIGYARLHSEKFPVFLQQAVVAVEDRRFYSHRGIDIISIGRALYKNILTRGKTEGASTITQQLARTLFLNQEKTYFRKIREIILALALEQKYSKDKILYMYLNEIYMGRGCSGMPMAAQSYFGKSINELSHTEICVLAGMIKAPELYTPDGNLKLLQQSFDTVINILIAEGIISAQDRDGLDFESLEFQAYTPPMVAHPYFVAYLKEQLKSCIGEEILFKPGLKIYTTLDRDIQKTAEEVTEYYSHWLAQRRIKAGDMALVSVSPDSGAIRAFIGGVDFGKNQVNMALLPRQPGSAIKPFYYAAALDEGLISPDSMVNNRPRDFGNYFPVNYAAAPDLVTVKEALIHSYNVASLEVLEKVGISKAIKKLQEFGFTTITKQDRNMAIGLGGMEKGVSPLQMAAALAVFADNGRYHEGYGLEEVVDSYGKTIFAHNGKYRWVISSTTAQIMDDMLQAVVRQGTGKNAYIKYKCGGKTGTTSDSRDIWYAGYTEELSTAIWIGNSDGSKVEGYGTWGGTLAAPLWRDYMKGVYSKQDRASVSATKQDSGMVRPSAVLPDFLEPVSAGPTVGNAKNGSSANYLGAEEYVHLKPYLVLP